MENNNNRDIKLCPVCGSKNKSAYKYCNECGAALNQEYYNTAANSVSPPVYRNTPQYPGYGANQTPPYGGNPIYYNGQFGQEGYTPYPPYGNNINAPYLGTPDFSGVSAKDVYDFTGDKPDLFNKIRTQHFTGKKGPYCWPLLILGIIFGFFGMGCWYLYHKMYKPALSFFAASVAEFAVSIYTKKVIFDLAYRVFDNEDLNALINSAEFDYFALEEKILGMGGIQIGILDSISSFISFCALVLAIVLPFFAYSQYKNHALKKIRAEYAKSPMPDIISVGGTKGGLVATAAVIYGVANIVAICILVASFTMGIIEKTEKYAEDNDNNSYYSDEYEQLPFGNAPFGSGEGSGDIW